MSSWVLSLVLVAPVLVALAGHGGGLGTEVALEQQRGSWGDSPYNYSHLLPMAQNDPCAQELPQLSISASPCVLGVISAAA